MTEPPAKRRRISNAGAEEEPGRAKAPASLTQPISPPRKKSKTPSPERILHPSPFRLTHIKDVPADGNIDAVRLGEILGDPLISECWEFNYLHDIDFLMQHFDVDTRALVNVHIVHGFWKRDDPSRLNLEQQKRQYQNVQLHTAYMPEMFGTHHSKMLVLFRHDDTAQVIIHTANMIAKDWTNMTNGAWLSPPLPKLLGGGSDRGSLEAPVGAGSRFKFDLLSYFRAYNTQRKVCQPLVDELSKYDFSAVRGALVASVPGRHSVHDDEQTRWGWAGLKHALRSVPVQPGKSEIVVQISSIATLGGTDTWLQKTLFDSMLPGASANPRPKFKVVFPTADEIRRSLDGYASGASIHTKTQSAQQQKQMLYLRPIFCHWANDSEKGVVAAGSSGITRDGGRKRAAPHIKTYIRYNGEDGGTLDWALLTSANISKQAWGEAASTSREMRISSWEIGVLVWPELIAGNDKAKMVGAFKMDMPLKEGVEGDQPLVGLRIPYNLPLQRYSQSEEPWVATANYSEPDWMGRKWESWER